MREIGDNVVDENVVAIEYCLNTSARAARKNDELTLIDEISQFRHDLRFGPVRLQPLLAQPRSITKDETVALARLHDVLPTLLPPAIVSPGEPDDPALLARGTGCVMLQEDLVAPLECSSTQNDVVVHDHDIPRSNLFSPVQLGPEALVHAVDLAEADLDVEGVRCGEGGGEEKVGEGSADILPDDEDLTERRRGSGREVLEERREERGAVVRRNDHSARGLSVERRDDEGGAYVKPSCGVACARTASAARRRERSRMDAAHESGRKRAAFLRSNAFCRFFWSKLGCAACGVFIRVHPGFEGRGHVLYRQSQRAFLSRAPHSASGRAGRCADADGVRCTQKTLSQTLSLHPSYFTPALREYLIELLHSTVEGSCSGRLGYIIAVLDFKPPSRGKIVEGGAEFTVSYTAVVYRPFRGEVVDGVVGSVNKVTLSFPSATFAAPDGQTLLS